jgi:hypothetical protein
MFMLIYHSVHILIASEQFEHLESCDSYQGPRKGQRADVCLDTR